VASKGSWRGAKFGLMSFSGFGNPCFKKTGASTSERGAGRFRCTGFKPTVLPPTWVDPAGSPAILNLDWAASSMRRSCSPPAAAAATLACLGCGTSSSTVPLEGSASSAKGMGAAAADTAAAWRDGAATAGPLERPADGAGFEPPLTKLSRFWSWSAVAVWLSTTSRLEHSNTGRILITSLVEVNQAI